MARRESSTPNSVDVNMTPLIDIAFQLITFFIMCMTLAKDEAAQRINLPTAPSAAVLADDRIPDSINVNVAWLSPKGTRVPVLLGWGLELDLSEPAGMEECRKLIRHQGALEKQRQIELGTYDPKKGLSTTVIVRFDHEVEYGVFQQIVAYCREAGFGKFQLKAGKEPPGRVSG